MVGSRTATAAVGVVASVGISVVLWWYLDTLLFFLLVPFVPILFRRRWGATRRTQSERQVCPRCGFATTDDSYAYCPYDGGRLEYRRHSE